MSATLLEESRTVYRPAQYLGRLDGRASHADIEELIEREVGKMNQAEFRANAVRCGKALARKGKEIQKIGAALVRKGQGEAPPKWPQLVSSCGDGA